MGSLGMNELKEAIKIVVDANLRVEDQDGSSIFKNGCEYMIQRPDGGCYGSDFDDVYGLLRWSRDED